MSWMWLLVPLGITNVSGRPYAFWSGSGSVILPWIMNALTIGAIFWWHHQCSVHHCFWYARRTTAANERACWRHHPSKKRSAADVHAAHHHALAVLHGHVQHGEKRRP